MKQPTIITAIKQRRNPRRIFFYSTNNGGMLKDKHTEATAFDSLNHARIYIQDKQRTKNPGIFQQGNGITLSVEPAATWSEERQKQMEEYAAAF